MNFPNLPDSINKIILALSVVVIYFSINGIIGNYISLDTHYKDYLNAIDSNERAEVELEFVKGRMLEQSLNVSNKYNVDNYIVDHDSLIRFTQKYNSGKNVDIARDILVPIWNSYMAKSNEVKLHGITVERRLKEYERKGEEVENNLVGLTIAIIAAVLAFIVSASQLDEERRQKAKGDSYLVREKGKISEWCQSCGRRFNSIIVAGTNSDQSVNYSFCNDCFTDGNFTEDNEIAYNKAISLVKAADIPMSKINRKVLLKRINNLDRWKKDNY